MSESKKTENTLDETARYGCIGCLVCIVLGVLCAIPTSCYLLSEDAPAQEIKSDNYKITFAGKVTISKDYKPSIVVATSLPEGTSVTIILNGENGYQENDFTEVVNGKIMSKSFDDNGQGLERENYIFTVRVDTILQPESFYNLFGKEGLYISGEYLTLTEERGITIEYNLKCFVNNPNRQSSFDLKKAKEEARELLKELLIFRCNEDFYFYGFGQGGPYCKWVDKVEALSDKIPKRNGLKSFSLAVNNMRLVAWEYVQTKGFSNNFINLILPKICETLKD